MNPSRIAILIAAGVASLGLLFWSTGPAWSFAWFTVKEEAACGQCHFDPVGGGSRTKFGFDYATTRNEPTEDEAWPELDLPNRVGRAFYFGTDTNGMYLYSDSEDDDGSTISTFFQMQSALYFTFNPIKNMFVTYNLDWNEFSGSQTRDVYGLVQDNNENFYAKLGRIPGVYGLRQFDHTAAIRSGFLNAESGGTGGFLPYRSTASETGIELGARPGQFQFSAQLTNGGTAFSNRAQALSGLGVWTIPRLQIGLMGYDRWRSSDKTRASRFGGYGVLMVPYVDQLFLQGEVGLGTDDDGQGRKKNLRASYIEAIYEFSRAFRLRGKYDFVDLDREIEGNRAERYAIGGDITPIPFSTFVVQYRRIVAETLPDQNEALFLWYFYY